MAGTAGPGGGVCCALTALETSSNHLSASEGVRLCPLCICAAAGTAGGERREASGGTQDEAAVGEKMVTVIANFWRGGAVGTSQPAHPDIKSICPPRTPKYDINL